MVCPSRAAIVRWARCVFLSCARAISCALVQVGRDVGRAHDLGDHALDLLVDHRSFVHLDVVSTARTTRVFAGSGEASRARVVRTCSEGSAFGVGGGNGRGGMTADAMKDAHYAIAPSTVFAKGQQA